MKKIYEFTSKYGTLIMLPLILVTFLKTCGTNSRIEKNGKRIDELTNVIKNNNDKVIKEIKLEGLRSEKRMIQSTDRKMLDVTRQSVIDKEIENLSK